MQIVLESAEDTFQLPHYPIECYRCDTRKYGEPTLLHWHFCCEMVFMHHGEQQVTIGESSFTLGPGDMVYIHPRQVHEFVSRSDFCDFTLLKFNTSLLFSREEYEPELQYMRPFLEESGYRTEEGCPGVLRQLSQRLCRGTEFPHEIGVVLGYPLEDVVGFIRHRGRDFTCSGCWKCYGDPEAARRRFASYRRCTAYCLQQLRQGVAVTRMIAA